MLSCAELEKACAEPEEATQTYRLHHAMYRVKDPKISLDFYTRILGMRLLFKIDNEAMKFTIYFVGFCKKEDIPEDLLERKKWAFTCEFAIELVHNYGTENDPNFKYHHGNSEPKGFGHIALVVPDTQAATDRFEKLNVKFIKKPNEGKMKGIVFVADPDGYWVELIDDEVISRLP